MGMAYFPWCCAWRAWWWLKLPVLVPALVSPGRCPEVGAALGRPAKVQGGSSQWLRAFPRGTQRCSEAPLPRGSWWEVWALAAALGKGQVGEGAGFVILKGLCIFPAHPPFLLLL